MATVLSMTTVLVFAVFVSCVTCSQILTRENYRYVYTNWRHLVGEPVDEAALRIHQGHPYLKIRVYMAKDGISSHMEKNAVLLYEDDDGRVRYASDSVEEIPIESKVWPELVGLSANDAVERILLDKPDAETEVFKTETEGSTVNRVRIFVNSDNIVVEAPQSG